MSKSLRIVGLQAENVKRLKAVTIKPSGAVVKVKGRNGQGKTSLLDSIQLALGGKSIQPPEVIRKGEERARVLVDLGDLVVERRWTGNEKSYLEVRSKDGAKFPSPQAMLDKLTSSLAFDPIAFMRLEPKKQLATLRKLVGVDTADLDAERARVFEQRTQVNRELATAETKLAAVPAVEAPDEELSLQALLDERAVLQEQKAENDRVRREAQDAQREALNLRQGAEQASAQVKALEEQLKQARTAELLKLASAQAGEATAQQLAVAAAALEDPDLTALDTELRTIEDTNRKVRQRKARLELVRAATTAGQKAHDLTKQLELLDEEKRTLIAGAKFPVDGMGFGDEGITLNGLPLEQASSAEQLRASFAMCAALNPELRVALIRDGSLLDDDSFALIEEMALADDMQVWVEVVGKAGECSVLIEDGEASGPDAEVAHG